MASGLHGYFSAEVEKEVKMAMAKELGTSAGAGPMPFYLWFPQIKKICSNDAEVGCSQKIRR